MLSTKGAMRLLPCSESTGDADVGKTGCHYTESDPSVFEPKLTVEAAYQHMQSDRFRHMAGFRRWRLDKRPGDCTLAQLEVVPPKKLMEIFPRER